MMGHPTPKPTITLDVDAANPGQFLACCGLLELASRLDAEAVGWFEDNIFHLLVSHSSLVEEFYSVTIHPMRQDEPSPPVHIAEPFNLRLDWWEDEAAIRAGFKTWSGGQRVMLFLDDLRAQASHLTARHGVQPMLKMAKAIKKPRPAFFDSRLSRLTSIDLGFSSYDARLSAAYAPAVDVLALIGMQRFRPITIEHRERYGYRTWAQPAPVRLAAAIAHGLIPLLSLEHFTFPLVVRTGGKYKAFGPATTDRSNHD